MVVYVAAGLLEAAIIVWFVGSIRKRIAYEIAASTGALAGVPLYFISVSAFSFSPELHVLWSAPTVQKIIGIALMVCSAVLAVSSVLTLRLRGKPTDAWESTTVLFTGGVYRFVRHPLYTSAILLMIGCPLVRPTVVSIILFVVSTSAFVLAAHFEDELNVAKFGDEYEKYRLRLFRILPPLY